MGSAKTKRVRSRGSAGTAKLSAPSTRRRGSRKPPPPKIHPRGPYNRRGSPWTPSRYTEGWQWVRFRLRVGLGDTAEVARLLGVSVRSIRRYEYGRAPEWYQAALVGLAGLYGDRDEGPLRP